MWPLHTIFFSNTHPKSIPPGDQGKKWVGYSIYIIMNMICVFHLTYRLISPLFILATSALHSAVGYHLSIGALITCRSTYII